jgi:hypothetical protein
MWFVKNPEWFDVIVTDNMFGDIITDLGAMIQGGMGIAAGGNINPGRDLSMFEPIGGSAPKYTGNLGVINPLAAVCAGAMMMDSPGRASRRWLNAIETRGDQVGHCYQAEELCRWQDGLFDRPGRGFGSRCAEVKFLAGDLSGSRTVPTVRAPHGSYSLMALAHVATTVVEIPPRAPKIPRTSIRRGARQDTRSSRI